MTLLKKLEGNKEFWFAIFVLFLFYILRLPSLFEPLWYGDEGIYQVIGSSLNNGKLLYQEIFDNKPPLLYWLYSFFHSDQFMIRLASLMAGAFSVVIFFLLSKKLFKNNIKYITTFIFAIFFGLPIFEGNIANAENFMILPIIAASFFVVSQKRFFIAGLLLGIAFLFKIVAIFDLSAFLVFCLIIYFDSLRQHLNKLFSLTAGFFLPIFTAILFFFLNGALSDFINAVFIANISYVSYANKIGEIPLLLLAKFIILAVFIFYVFMKRKILNKTLLFILIWFAFSIFNSLFSQRSYNHYVLVLIPSLSLMIGLILFDRKYQKAISILLLISVIILIKTFGVPKFAKNINYYQNFISYIKGEKTTASYQAFFDRNTPVDYEITRFIKPKLGINDTIFVWGNNAQLYQLANVIAPAKYVVAYHISNYKDGALSTKIAIEKTKPKFIIIMPNQNEIPYTLTNYFEKININKVAIYERSF